VTILQLSNKDIILRPKIKSKYKKENLEKETYEELVI
jgi:hypothetical protein